MKELVHWFYNDARGIFSKANDKEVMTRVFLTDEQGRELLKKGKVAALIPKLYGLVEDPYFTVERERGYTRRARKYGTMRRTMAKNWPDQENALTRLTGKVADYVDYVFIDISFIDNYQNSMIKNDDRFFNENFIKKEHFTKDFLLELIEFAPRTLLDNAVISSYKNEELPNFFLELKSVFPNVYQAALEESEWLQKFDKNISYIDRKALVKTLNPGLVQAKITVLGCKGYEDFEWDGEKLITEIQTYNRETLKMEIVPSDKMEVKIKDDNVVNEDTEFTF